MGSNFQPICLECGHAMSPAETEGQGGGAPLRFYVCERCDIAVIDEETAHEVMSRPQDAA